ncbi:hypothetical protein E2I00_009738, partial [Balaenoptera physalus]
QSVIHYWPLYLSTRKKVGLGRPLARPGPRGPSGNTGARAGGRVPASGARIGAARARSEGDCFPSLRRNKLLAEPRPSRLPRAAGAEGEQVSSGRAGLLGWRGPAEPVRLTRLR